MLDTDLLVNALRSRGHAVDHVHKVPDNAGEYEFTIDGTLYTLEQARALLTEELPASANTTT